MKLFSSFSTLLVAFTYLTLTSALPAPVVDPAGVAAHQRLAVTKGRSTSTLERRGGILPTLMDKRYVPAFLSFGLSALEVFRKRDDRVES